MVKLRSSIHDEVDGLDYILVRRLPHHREVGADLPGIFEREHRKFAYTALKAESNYAIFIKNSANTEFFSVPIELKIRYWGDEYGG